MQEVAIGEMVYVFMGESLLRVRVMSLIDEDSGPVRIGVEYETNTYMFYSKDCYPTKDEAIKGMLIAITKDSMLRQKNCCSCTNEQETQKLIYSALKQFSW